MDQLSAGLTDDPQNKYVADWKTIKEFRTEVYDAVGSKLEPRRGEAGLKKLADLLGQDIDTSVKTLWKSPNDSLNSIKTANALNAEMKDTFNKRILGRTMDTYKANADPSQVFALAKTRPEAAAEFVRALGPNQQRPIKAHFFEKLMQKADSPDTALTILDSPSYKKVFSSPDRADLTNLFRTLRRTESSGSTSISMNYRKASIALGLGTSLANQVTGDKKVSTSALVGATALIGSKAFAEKVLLNPRFARSASRLAGLDPSSSEATFLRKTLMTAMRGINLVVHLSNGEDRDAQIDVSGNIKLNDQ